MIRHRIHELTPSQKQRYDAITIQFDEAWWDHPEAPPSIESYLPSDDPLRMVTLIALIKTEMECRREKDEGITTADYLERFPELQLDSEARVELFRWEREISVEPATGPAGQESPSSQLAARLEAPYDQEEEMRSWMALEGFTRLERIGQGSMGIVYAAWEERLKRQVALKVLYPRLTSDETSSARFRLEAEIVAGLNHPNVVEIHRVGERQNQVYCVFEYCPGGSLEEQLHAGPLEPDVAARRILEIARGVHAAHQTGVIHRDLKPANVLFSADGRAKVADFGLAKRVDDTNLTRSGELLGTISYAAPEQLSKRSQEVTQSADIYALGSILYHCLTGRPPFVAPTYLETYLQVLKSDAVRPSRMVRVPRDLETICLKCLAKNPQQRYPNVTELKDDVQRYLQRQPIRARPPSSTMRLGLWCRRNPPRAIASGVVIAALLTIVALSVLFGVQQRRAAAERLAVLTESQRQVALSTWDRGRQICEEGEVGQGLLVLVRALELVPDGSEDADLREALRIEISGWYEQCHTLRQVLPHPSQVLALVASPDGAHVATGCADGSVHSWHIESGKRLWTSAGHEAEVHAVAIGAEGAALATGGADGQIVFWNLATGEKVRSLTGLGAAIHAVALSSDGRHALSGDAGGQCLLWNLFDDEPRLILQFDGPVLTVGFGPTEHHLFAGGANAGAGELRVFDMATEDQPTLILQQTSTKRIRAAAISHQTNTLIIGDDDWNATFIDIAGNGQIATTDYARGCIGSVALDPGGATALVGAEDSKTALLWDVEALREHWEQQKDGSVVLKGQGPPRPVFPPLLHPDTVTAVAFVPPDGRMLLTACEDGFVRVWRRAPGHSQQILEHNPRHDGHADREHVVRITAIDPSGQLAATAGDDGTIRLWNVPSGTRIEQELDCSSPVAAIAFMADGTLLVSGTKDGRIQVWDCQRFESLGEPILHQGGVSGLSASRDGDLILVGGSGVAQRWSVMSRKKLGDAIWHGQIGVSIGTAMSQKRERLLTLGEDGTAKLWNWDGRFVGELPHQNQVRGGEFAYHRPWIITASDDRTARVWDAFSGEPLATLNHEGELFGTAFFPNDRVVTASRDGAHIWDVSLARRVGPSYRSKAIVMHAACSPDGRTVVLGDWDGYGALWFIPQPIQGDVSTIRQWIESEVGMILEADGGRQLLSGDAWRAAGPGAGM